MENKSSSMDQELKNSSQNGFTPKSKIPSLQFNLVSSRLLKLMEISTLFFTVA